MFAVCRTFSSGFGARLLSTSSMSSSSETAGCPHLNQQQQQQEKPRLKTFADIPGPRFGMMLEGVTGNPHTPFDMWSKLHARYGQLFALNLLGQKIVISANPDHWAGIVRAAGKTPGPLQLLPWLKREKDLKAENPGHTTNLIALVGQEWRENRTVLDAVFSSIPRVQSYIPMVDHVGDDLVALLHRRLDTGTLNGQLYHDLYGFSNEVIGQVVYGHRLGNLAEQRSELSEEFFHRLLEVFQLSSELLMGLPTYMFWRTRKYKAFLRAFEQIEQLSPQLLQNSDDWHAQHGTAPADRIDLVAHMRNSGQSRDRILSNALTMFIAGSDSTTHTLMWLLYNLGRFPRVQECLRQEVSAVLGASADGRLTSEALHQMKYLRATVKESMRLTPSASGFVRVLDEPIEIDGYEVPPKTFLMAMSFLTNKKEQYFPKHDDFLPERWLEEDRSKRPHPWAHLPFGSGPRICQAFRLAELEAYVAMAKLVMNFSWTTSSTVRPYLDLFIKPDRAIEFQWKRL